MTVDQDHYHHDDGELKTRLVTVIEAAYKTLVAVEHVYDNDVCSACGTLSTGFVGIKIRNEPDDKPEPEDERGDERDGEKCASALLDAGEALLLADRITRAAHLVLETTEEPADFEREGERCERLMAEVLETTAARPFPMRHLKPIPLICIVSKAG